MVFSDITPSTSHPKILRDVGELNSFRRPELYGDLQASINSLPAASMYGPVGPDQGPKVVRLGILQTSWYHSQEWTLKRIGMQIEYAASQGAQIGIFPELFAHERNSAALSPGAAAEIGARALAMVQESAKEHSLWVVASLVEGVEGQYYSTVFLVNDLGEIHSRYRKAHLSSAEREWATPGNELVVAETPLGRFGLMIGNEVWLPEVARVLSLRGAEAILHPVDWNRPEAAHQAATERTEENRTHLVSVARTDNPAEVGSQVVFADRFVPGQPIALMRYPSAAWTRPGFEEDLFVDLNLTDSHSKVQGYHLDPLATRQPHLYGAMARPFMEGGDA
jgi:predicted amidohydrolase